MFFFRCCAAGMPHLLLAMSMHTQGTQASCLRRVWKTRHAEAICAIREICEGHNFLADLADLADFTDFRLLRIFRLQNLPSIFLNS